MLLPTTPRFHKYLLVLIFLPQHDVFGTSTFSLIISVFVGYKRQRPLFDSWITRRTNTCAFYKDLRVCHWTWAYRLITRCAFCCDVRCINPLWVWICWASGSRGPCCQWSADWNNWCLWFLISIWLPFSRSLHCSDNIPNHLFVMY